MSRGKIIVAIIITLLFLCILFSVSITATQNFSEPIVVNDYPDHCVTLTRVVSCVDDDLTIHIIWEEHRESILLYYAKSDDHGQTFSKSILVNQSAQWYPSIDSDKNCNLHVTWTSNSSIYYSKLIKGENEFRPAIRVSDNESKGCFFSSIAVDNNENVHITWTDYRNSVEFRDNRDVFYAKSSDGGDSFGPNIRVVDDQEKHNKAISIIDVDKNNTPHIIYKEMREENDGEDTVSNLYHTKSVDGGLSFIAPTQVNDNVNQRLIIASESIFIDKNDKIHVTFTDYRNDGEGIYYTYSENKGRSFSKDVMVSEYAEKDWGFGGSNVVIDNEGIIHIVWSDTRYSSKGVSNIYYSNSTNNGVSFNNNINISRQLNLDDCDGQSMAIDKYGYLYVAWLGTKDSNTNVYFSTTISPIDTDRDGWVDCIDAFPENPTQWQDEDGDGYGDNSSGWDPVDIFPSDPTEWNDTDNDGVGDNSDYYPNDPSRFEYEKKGNEVNWIMVLILIIIIIIVIIVSAIIIRRWHSKRKQKPPNVF